MPSSPFISPWYYTAVSMHVHPRSIHDCINIGELKLAYRLKMEEQLYTKLLKEITLKLSLSFLKMMLILLCLLGSVDHMIWPEKIIGTVRYIYIKLSTTLNYVSSVCAHAGC